MRFAHELPHDATALQAAREQLARWCRAAGLDDEAIVIIANELCTNALRRGEGPVRLRAAATVSQLCVSVEQAVGPTRERPRLLPASPWQSGGRGLRIVSAMARSWGWQRDQHTLTVWATVPRAHAA